MKSLKLNNNDWDIRLNSIGNIDIIENEKEDIAQTVATAIRLFQTDYIFNEDLGIPYIPEILGKSTTNFQLEPYIQEEATRIKGVESISLENLDIKDRELKADIIINYKEE